jgi:hypothetical protein
MKNSKDKLPQYAGEIGEKFVQSIGQSQTKFIELAFPFGVCEFAAGPYKSKPTDFPGVKLAVEIQEDFAIKLDIPDFSVPDPDEAEAALLATIALVRAGATPYIGCMGGTGRTGLFLALLAKVAMFSQRRFTYRGLNPVELIREIYRPGAVETKEQELYVEAFDVSYLVDMVKRFR